MSADEKLVQDDAQMAEGSAHIGNEADIVAPFDQPLNAEEATILVLHFLMRMRKRILTPRKAVLNDNNVFVVDVDIKGATATVHINAETREILEYSIVQRPKEEKPLPISPRKIAMGLGAVVVLVVLVMSYNFLLLYADSIVNSVPPDYFLIGGLVVLVVGGIVWWRRRAA